MVILHQLGALVALAATAVLAQPAGTSYSLNMRTLVLHSGDGVCICYSWNETSVIPIVKTTE